MTVPWSTTLLRADTFVAEFAPSLELPLRMCMPLVTVVGLGVVVWWGSRRDEGRTRRRVEVTLETVRCRCPLIGDPPTDATVQPTPYALFCVFGYLTATLLILDVRTLTCLLPFVLAGTCNLRFSTLKSTDDGSEPETSLKTAGGKFSSTPHTPGTVTQLRIRIVPQHDPSKQSPLEEIVPHSR